MRLVRRSAGSIVAVSLGAGALALSLLGAAAAAAPPAALSSSPGPAAAAPSAAAPGVAAPAAAAPAAAAPSAPTAPSARVFALIVTNNRSASLQRPDLRYADDDGARYHALFRAIAAAPEDVTLLTRFDAPSARAYPQLQPGLQPPRIAAVRAALAGLRGRIQAAHRAGQRTAFYFVFAGHGDVDRGKGFLELEDARLDADFLEREVVDGLPADVQHLILDSCNSFFVINPRKPGGRRWATPQDLTTGFAQRHPQVGLLLSTNAEAEVYEWSELGAGVFSYEVRTGLAGAADADSDGVIRYDEIAGYLKSANRDVLNEDLRPRIFARGPFGHDDADLFLTTRLGGPWLVLGPGERHIWVRGADGERALDVHKEAQGAVKVALPKAGGPFSVYEQTTPPGAARPVTIELPIPPGAPSVTLAELTPAPSSIETRGGEAIFGRLFADAWGPQAFARYLHERGGDPDPVFGVAKQDEGPIQRYLQNLKALGGKGVAATGELADAVIDPLRARAPEWMGGRADVSASPEPSPATDARPRPARVPPRPSPWEEGRVPEGDNAFTLRRHDVRLSLLGRSGFAFTERTELSTVLALDFSGFANLSLKHRFAEGRYVSAAWKLAAAGGLYALDLAGAAPLPVLVGHEGYLLAAYELAELQLSVQPLRSLTMSVRAGAIAAQVRTRTSGFASAPEALAFRSDGGSGVFGLNAGFETDVAVSAHDALVLDASAWAYQRSDYALVTAALGWTHAWSHVHVQLAAIAVLDLPRASAVPSHHRFLPYANVDWTF